MNFLEPETNIKAFMNFEEIETELLLENEKKRPKLLKRMTGSFRSVPEPEDVLSTLR